MRLALVAHDAGGANVLAALARRQGSDMDWSVLVAGPARGILSALTTGSHDLEADVSTADLACLLQALAVDGVLTGTGWQSCLERNSIQAARQLGLPVCSVLDHWVNFRERFGYPGPWLENLPDRVLVGDAYALAQARADSFPEACLGTVENPYLAAFASCARVNRPPRSAYRQQLLFLGEPLAIDFAGAGYGGAATLLDVAAQVVDLALAQPGIDLVVRAHPSEPLSRYDFLRIHPKSDHITLHGASEIPLEQDIEAADVVVGMSSMALLAAAAAGCRTLAYLPEGIGQALPHREIHRCRTPAEFTAALIAGGDHPVGLDLCLFSTSLTEALQPIGLCPS